MPTLSPKAYNYDLPWASWEPQGNTSTKASYKPWYLESSILTCLCVLRGPLNEAYITGIHAFLLTLSASRGCCLRKSLGPGLALELEAEFCIYHGYQFPWGSKWPKVGPDFILWAPKYRYGLHAWSSRQVLGAR